MLRGLLLVRQDLILFTALMGLPGLIPPILQKQVQVDPGQWIRGKNGDRTVVTMLLLPLPSCDGSFPGQVSSLFLLFPAFLCPPLPPTYPARPELLAAYCLWLLCRRASSDSIVG